MKKKMQEVEVTTEHGQIYISQPGLTDEGHCVGISPDQVPTIIKWLEEAASELQTEVKGKK